MSELDGAYTYEPTAQEITSNRVCRLLVYALGRLGRPIPWDIVRASRSAYGDTQKLAEHQDLLDKLCEEVINDQSSVIPNDSENDMSKQLATWWEEWKEARMKKYTAEKNAAIRSGILASALAKLSPEELRVLQEEIINNQSNIYDWTAERGTPVEDLADAGIAV
jgi:hypothetical protein